MTSLLVLLVAIFATGLVLVGPVLTVESMNNAYPCPDAERVCASTLRVGPASSSTSSIDEGPYCTCDTCPKLWDDTGDQSLTWHHHERSDWIVQYKFCEPIIPKKTCAENDIIAAVIEADSNGWNPRLKSMTCRCPNGNYYLKGWTLEGQKHWDYHYTCERPVCVENEPCVRHYMDAKMKKTAGYRFMCACTDGAICPTNKSEGKTEKADASDSEGPYINGYCRKIQSHLRKKYLDKMNKNNNINKS